VIVDAVTTRRANFHAELLRLLETDVSDAWQSSTGIYAVAYRSATMEEKRELRAWPESLAVGAALPRLPLWLGVDICVALDLDASYQATCEDLRIRQAG
jgi:hypothetical protein